jgi:hypothetical protein
LFSSVKNTNQENFKCPSQPLAEEHLQVTSKKHTYAKIKEKNGNDLGI